MGGGGYELWFERREGELCCSSIGLLFFFV